MPYYDTVTNVLEAKQLIPNSGWTLISYNGTSNAAGRKYLGVFNRSPYKLLITTNSSALAESTRVIKGGGERIFPYSDKVSLYGRCGVAGSVRIIVTEECG